MKELVAVLTEVSRRFKTSRQSIYWFRKPEKVILKLNILNLPLPDQFPWSTPSVDGSVCNELIDIRIGVKQTKN